MRSALVVIDMLNDFVDGALGNPPATEIVAPIRELASRARQTRDWVVVYANDAHELSDVELRVFPPHAMAGTPGAAVVDELRPQHEDVVVPKRFYSSFTRSTLADELRAHEIGRLVLVGQHTDCCVRHTAYDAFARGFELAVCPDATTVFGPGSDEPVPERQARSLEYLRTYYGARLVKTGSVT
ncbi:MAG TPA: isochorismatase family cysteine hydrolase [Acidimicrobiales bacterium]|nr:isochorismatase family cysteine hydrolase [Acidimicrobiales bacterium]